MEDGGSDGFLILYVCVQFSLKEVVSHVGKYAYLLSFKE